ncbi:MAG: sugar ABC transporter ATP-binding protein [Lachnospiraceae bacterium]|nr:sugar ABC transporter ATP-binding protein [Lachnospiraceae bacterium]
MAKLLTMDKIDKSFPGVHALKKVSFDLKEGEVHAILGENGAGKSTLMNILAGTYPADSGEISIDGEKKDIRSTKAAQELGISFVHQELLLAPNVTVAGNIYMNREPRGRFGAVDDKKMYEDAKKLFDMIEVNIDPHAVVDKLSIAAQQIVEIVRALSFQTRILILDEPTATLSSEETDKLFKIINSLKSQGVGIIYISHRMEEIFTLADRVTVFRDGQHIATHSMQEIEKEKLLELMVGRKLNKYYIHEKCSVDELIFEARDLCTKEKLQHVSIQVKRNEILGISGIVGAGRSELARAIFGVDRLTSGTLYMEGQKLTVKSNRDAIRAGIAMVSENRKKEGLIIEQTLSFNLTLCVLKEFIKGLRVNQKKESNIIELYSEKLKIKASSEEQRVKQLSGGNQQKIVLAKWLATKPKLLILDEPTRGIDVGAKAEIYALLDELVHQGISIVVISSELEEIMNLADRVYVMFEGRVMSCLEGKDINQNKIMYYATGGK